MEKMNFEQIVSGAVALQGRPFEMRACPDQYLGALTEIIGKPQFPMRESVIKRPNSPCLIMVLESPHVDEFKDEPGPAKGFTGEMIRKYLPDALGRPLLEGMGLLLLNAVQYQCSLGSNTVVYRDRIFRATWSQGGKEDFLARFQSVVMPEDWVMNCCTKGNDFEINTPLRSLVELAVRQTVPQVQTIRRMHPASWRDQAWRGKEWRHNETELVQAKFS
jgi:hypothetical protein